MKKITRLALLSMCSVSASVFAEIPPENSHLHLNTSFKRFNTVSCDKTATTCLAVGFGEEHHLHERFVYTTNDGGKTWSEPTLLPAPKEENTPILSDNPNYSSISCSESGQNCVVTSTAIIEKIPTPIAYKTEDGGITWSEPKVLPLNRSINKKQSYQNDSLITSVSCNQAGTVCMMAGWLTGNDEVAPLLYSTNDAGKTWKSYSVKTPSYQAPSELFRGTALSDISCNFSGSTCFAVGNSVITTSFFGSIYTSHAIVYVTTDSGAHWSKPKVIPYKQTDSNGSALTNVSCDGAGMQCTAVGFIYDVATNLNQLFSITTHNGGSTWDEMKLIGPGARLTPRSLRCDDSGKYCTVVGTSVENVSTIPIMKSIAYTTNDAGKTWELVNADFPNQSKLEDIFCDESGENCLAVGIKAELKNTMKATAINKLLLNNFILPKPQKAKA